MSTRLSDEVWGWLGSLRTMSFLVVGPRVLATSLQAYLVLAEDREVLLSAARGGVQKWEGRALDAEDRNREIRP